MCKNTLTLQPCEHCQVIAMLRRWTDDWEDLWVKGHKDGCQQRNVVYVFLSSLLASHRCTCQLYWIVPVPLSPWASASICIFEIWWGHSGAPRLGKYRNTLLCSSNGWPLNWVTLVTLGFLCLCTQLWFYMVLPLWRSWNKDANMATWGPWLEKISRN